MNVDDWFEGNPRVPEVVTSAAPIVIAEAPVLRFSQSDTGKALAHACLTVMDRLKATPIETDEQETKTADLRVQLKAVLKDIEHHRKQIVEPIKRQAALVDAEARNWRQPLEDLDRDVEQALLARMRYKEGLRVAEQDRLRAAAEAAAVKQGAAEAAGDVAGAEAAAKELMRVEAVPVGGEVKGYKTDSGSQSKRLKWWVEVVDAEQVPDVYWEINIGRLQAAVDAGARQIDGCNIVERESLVVRTRG